MPKVSIIIPFNNVENYIEECLQSVVNQTLKDIEIIVINDASEDNSLKIVKKTAKNDNRIKIIQLDERHGQGYARNRGIEIAQGEYIGFVDSDDFIMPEMFEELYNNAKQNDTDITMCLAREFDDVTKKYTETDYYSLIPLKTFENNTFSAEDTKNKLLDINVALWNKIYKKEYLINTGEKFPEGFIYEDLPFFYGTYLSAKRIQIVWKYFYNYRINRKTSTMRQSGNKILDRVQMVSLSYEKLKNVPYLSDLKKNIQGWIINDLFHRYTLLKESYQREYFFLMKKVFKNLEIENIEDNYWKKVYHFEGYKLVINNSFENFNQKVFNEYLDIHKVEDRITSQITDRHEIDSKISNVYEDINKNYKYTENLVSGVENKLNDVKESVTYNMERINKVAEKIKEAEEKTNSTITNVVNEITKFSQDNINHISNEFRNLNIQTDEKISRVYEEITKNYSYTNELTDKLRSDIKTSNDILAQNIKIQTDEKISRIYSDITENYKYTEQLVYNRNKDLLDEIRKNISENKEEFNTKLAENKNDIDKINQNVLIDINAKTDEKISKVYEEITKNYTYTEKLVESASSKTEYEVEEKISDIYNLITNNYTSTNNKIEEKSNETKNEISNLYEKINVLSQDYQQENNYLKEVQATQNEKINLLETILDDKINSFVTSQNNNLNLKVSEIYSYTNSELSKIFNELKSNHKELNEKLDYQTYETGKQISANKEEINKIKTTVEDKADRVQINDLSKDFEEKIQKLQDAHYWEMKELRAQFETQLNEQRVKYEQKLINMENQINETEQKYIESRKNIFQKIFGNKKKR